MSDSISHRFFNTPHKAFLSVSAFIMALLTLRLIHSLKKWIVFEFTNPETLADSPPFHDLSFFFGMVNYGICITTCILLFLVCAYDLRFILRKEPGYADTVLSAKLFFFRFFNTPWKALLSIGTIITACLTARSFHSIIKRLVFEFTNNNTGILANLSPEKQLEKQLDFIRHLFLNGCKITLYIVLFLVSIHALRYILSKEIGRVGTPSGLALNLFSHQAKSFFYKIVLYSALIVFAVFIGLLLDTLIYHIFKPFNLTQEEIDDEVMFPLGYLIADVIIAIPLVIVSFFLSATLFLIRLVRKKMQIDTSSGIGRVSSKSIFPPAFYDFCFRLALYDVAMISVVPPFCFFLLILADSILGPVGQEHSESSPFFHIYFITFAFIPLIAIGYAIRKTLLLMRKFDEGYSPTPGSSPQKD